MYAIQYICLTILLITALACDEPANCQKHQKLCATREKFRERCPCTCAPDISYTKCCMNQKFENEICRTMCSFDAAQGSKYKSLAVKCFNDFFKLQYCVSNGYKSYHECCLKKGVTKDMPGKPGCSIFCEVKMPACARIFDYFHCAIGENFAKSVACARENYDLPQWIPNYGEIRLCT